MKTHAVLTWETETSLCGVPSGTSTQFVVCDNFFFFLIHLSYFILSPPHPRVAKIAIWFLVLAWDNWLSWFIDVLENGFRKCCFQLVIQTRMRFHMYQNTAEVSQI